MASRIIRRDSNNGSSPVATRIIRHVKKSPSSQSQYGCHGTKGCCFRGTTRVCRAPHDGDLGKYEPADR